MEVPSLKAFFQQPSPIEAVLRYAFAVGLTSACLLEAESAHHELEHLELAEWRSEERGAMQPPEGLPPAPSVERRARAFVDFFSRGEGARPPIAPRDLPAEFVSAGKKKAPPPGKWRLARSSLRFQPPPGEASGLPPSGEAGLCLCSRLSFATICCHFGTLGFVRVTLSLIADL